MSTKQRRTKEQLHTDIRTLHEKSIKEGYFFLPTDAFALGYMSAKYKLDKIINNQEAVIEACRKYDKHDDLGLLDTIGETLIDLDVIVNDGRI